MSFSLSPHAKACAQVGVPLFAAALGLSAAVFISKAPAQHSFGPDIAAQGYGAAAIRGYAAGPDLTAAPAWTRRSGRRDLDCLSAAVYYEARGESLAGQQAVAQVVLNRTRHPAFPKSVCAVVFQSLSEGGCQFSFVCDGAMSRPVEPEAWRRARQVAARALDGYVMAAVGRALSFHVASAGHAPGAVATLGRHAFFTGQAVNGAAASASAYARPAVARVSVITRLSADEREVGRAVANAVETELEPAPTPAPASDEPVAN